MEAGFAAVSHRAVAQRADLPLAATTYYFASLEELLEETVRGLAEGWLSAAHQFVEQWRQLPHDRPQLAEGLVRLVALAPVGVTGLEHGVLSGLYERYVEAARQPRLRGIVADFDAQLEKLIEVMLRIGTSGEGADTSEVNFSGHGRLMLAAIDGALLRALAEDDGLDSVTFTVQHLLDALAAATGATDPS